jgi:hypothetical protein
LQHDIDPQLINQSSISDACSLTLSLTSWPRCIVISRHIHLDISSILWRANPVHSVPSQSHSPSNVYISLSHNTSLTPTFDYKNHRPLEMGSTSTGTHQVLCRRCNVYINHGHNQHLTTLLEQHQSSTKCKLKYLGETSFALFTHPPPPPLLPIPPRTSQFSESNNGNVFN